ncbi:MAG: EAL domain-containing protein [Pseudomonadota bacterium]
MSTKTRHAYHDKGYLTLFAKGILEAINGAQCVALLGAGCNVIWEGPEDQVETVLWDRLLSVSQTKNSGLVEVDEHGHIYVFHQDQKETEFYQSICVYVRAQNPIDFDTVSYLLQPLIQSLQRQLTINAELSAVKKLSRDNQGALSLLSELEDLSEHSAKDLRIRQILALCREHFSASSVGVVVPNLEIREIVSDRIVDLQSPLNLKLLAQLFSAVKDKAQIVVTNTSGKSSLEAMFGDGRQLLLAPLQETHGEFVGTMLVARQQEFTPKMIRLARAASSKLTTLICESDKEADTFLHRHKFLNEVDELLERQPHSPHAMLFVDIDKLHVVNDSHGHMAGDEAIKIMASVLSEFAGADDIVGHLTGDCFVLFLRNGTEEKARAKAAAILDTIKNRPLEYQKRLIEITASIGIALIPDFAGDASTAVNVSELAAKTAKDRGGNRLTVFQDMDASIIRRRSDLDQVGDLQSALLSDRFVLYAQRIASLHKENSNKFEILIRMLDEQGNLVPPDKFLSAAERYQMMSAIDRWVINRAIQRIRKADNMLEINLTTFCINVSGQSLADDDFLPYVESLVRESGLSPDSLCFEITETAIVRNLDRAQRFIQQLRKLGCRFALDDFGTGYCSFAYLKDLPVQYLKLDGAFVRDLLEDPLSEAIVQSITHIGRVMGAATVAEHVENDMVKQKLQELNVDYVQGYAIGRPEPLTKTLDSMDNPIDLGLDSLLDKVQEKDG